MSFRLANVFGLVILIACAKGVRGQELYLINEPASSVPKGVFGVRLFSQHYRELDVTRTLGVLRIMYGATPRLSLMATASVSNHHDKKLPKDLISHTHTGTQTSYFTHPIKKGVKYPFLFNGVHLFAKYRFLSRDDQNRHFRMAFYGELSTVNVAHDEAEPNLMDDTGGYGAGIIATWLKNRFAMSLTTGYLNPGSYQEDQPDDTGGPPLPTEITYGDAFRYNLSLGYRLYPKKYEAYEQTNWNLYLELTGKSYTAARVVQGGQEIEARTVALQRGSYVEINPGIQRIVRSNTRIEFYYTLPFFGDSFVHFTPMWTIAVQRYFYPQKQQK